VYVNGNLLNQYSTTSNYNTTSNESPGGMFLRRHYDLGVHSSTSNNIQLEILVLPPPFVGKPTSLIHNNQTIEDGQGGNHEIAKSGAIAQYTAGWDWIHSTPDRNVGIWDGVDVDWVEGDVRLHDLHIKVCKIEYMSSPSSLMEEGADDGDEGRVGGDEMLLPLGDNVEVLAWVDLSLTATVHGVEQQQQLCDGLMGEFEYQITPSSNPALILARGTIRNVVMKQSVGVYQLGKISLPNVKLWWPHTHSSRNYQPLYSAKVIFRTNPLDATVDTRTTSTNQMVHKADIRSTFGIRTISSFTHPTTKSFALKVNGHPIFLTGGNWITTDQFLRYSTSSQRYINELTLLRHTGINAVRVWGGGISETELFYDATDMLGMLVYQEFWMTGDNNGRMAGQAEWPMNHGAYLANVRDVVVRLQNHPSLFLYSGGNELYPIPPTSLSNLDYDYKDGLNGTSPPQDINQGIKSFIADWDDNRLYVTSSVTDVVDTFDSTLTLGPRDGPYGMQQLETWYTRNPGFTSPLLTDGEVKLGVRPEDVKNGDLPHRNIGFQTEVGSVSQPELLSLERFLSAEALAAYPDCNENHTFGGSVHEDWTYYKFLPFTDDHNVDHICQFLHPPLVYDSSGKSHRRRMESLEDFNWAAQFVQYLQYKHLVEGYSYRMWEWYSAVFLWKTSSPSPSFRGAIYDSYLATNGGYWGVRAGLAGGQPVRLILNINDWTMHIINAISREISPSLVEYSAYSLKGVLLAKGNMSTPVLISGNTVAHLDESLPWVGGENLTIPSVVLYRLDMSYSSQGVSKSASNTYLLTDPSLRHSDKAHSRFAFLGAVRKERVADLAVRCSIDLDIECTIQNGDDFVAIMVKLSIVRPHGYFSTEIDRRILPSFYSDNYFTLLPGETTIVHITLDDNIVASCTTILVVIDGWNIRKNSVEVACNPAAAS
jgi:mannosylglycoprotein endo-beta-mannosidase